MWQVIGRPSWEEWLSSLDPAVRWRAVALRNDFRDLGARDPESWARSEISEGIPQLARFRFLRGLWQGDIDSWRDNADTWVANVRRELARYPHAPFADGMAVLRLVDELGASPAELGTLARMVACDAVGGVLVRLEDPWVGEDGLPEDLRERLPCWALVETAGPDDQLTGRLVGGLHESLLDPDISGYEGHQASKPGE
jgi:hypothetical protein